jgi:hypothetical protein
MNKNLVTGEPGVVGSRAIFRVMAAGREVRAMVAGPTHPPVGTMRNNGGIHPGAQASFIAADRDLEAGRLDAAAGCEYFDDRIRLPDRGQTS